MSKAGDSSRTRAGRKRRSGGNPTLLDVAAHAGVSTATVSRCLSHPEKVTSRLRERVEASITALGYAPHGPARTLASRRSHTIGVVVPTLDIASFASGVQALQKALFEVGHTPLLAISNYDPELELHHARSLVRHGVDGMVLVGADHTPDLIDLMQRNRIPFVNIWSYAPKSAHPCIGFDNRAAMRRITEHVIERGHRRIAMILGGAEHANDRSRHRRAGFSDAFDARGLPIPDERIVEVPYGISGGRSAFGRLMSVEQPPTAIVCGSDLFAIGVLMECRRTGVAVPDRLSLTGFDDLEISAHVAPALTTVHIPAREMGARAAAYLAARLAGEPVPDRVALDFRLVERDSVAPPPAVTA